ncbi:MAG TPA: type II secretion system F family protein [Aeromicrobium sp.]|nr:type II secretion system F family protein [Aeromicrobium sp.]
MPLIAFSFLAFAGAVVAVTYALLQPDLAALRSEQMKAESKVDGRRVKRGTPVFDLIDKVMKSFGLKPFSEEQLALAGIKSSPTSMVGTTLLIALTTLLVAYFLTTNFFVAFILAIISPLFVRMYVNSKTAKRRAKFDKQMAETMTLFSSALKSGMNVPNALANVAQEMDAPMGEELARVVNESRLGRDLIQGMRDTAVRMESKDFMWVTEAVAIQRESGGRLSEILDRVIETIAQRNELREKIASLAAEGKISAMVLMALPVGVGVMFMVMNPAYMEPLFTTVPGYIMLGVAAVLYALGGFWLSRMTKVKL